MLKHALARLVKEIQFHSPLRKYFFPRHVSNFSIPQLIYLCNCLEQVRDVDGSIAEIGCSTGRTTIFLNKYMDDQGIEKKYFAVDTFSGFVAEDIEYEVKHRGKKKHQLSGFQINNKKWYDYTISLNGIDCVESIQADINEYDLTSLGQLAFVLVDVDLYRPMKKGLGELYEALSPGGVMIADDCDPEHIRWDGADQAYKEFMEELVQPIEVVLGKLGVVRKPE